MHHAFKIGEAEYNLELSRTGNGYRLHLAEHNVPVNLHVGDDGFAILNVAGCSEPVLIATRGDEVFIHLGGAAYHLRYEHPLQRLAAQSHGAAGMAGHGSRHDPEQVHGGYYQSRVLHRRVQRP